MVGDSVVGECSFATGWESRPANGNFDLRIDVIIEIVIARINN
jgi:hypothetical protein